MVLDNELRIKMQSMSADEQGEILEKELPANAPLHKVDGLLVARPCGGSGKPLKKGFLSVGGVPYGACEHYDLCGEFFKRAESIE